MCQFAINSAKATKWSVKAGVAHFLRIHIWNVLKVLEDCGHFRHTTSDQYATVTEDAHIIENIALIRNT